MSSEFNAYSTWLGIPEDEQPPHYYRLLGLEPFEADPDVIRQAGQRILGLVKSREKGNLGSAARRLKAEVTFAAACLLDEKKKSQYDRELDAWFNEFEASPSSGSGEDFELEEPDLPMAKIVQRERSATKSKSGSGKSKPGSSVKTSGTKAGSGKTKAKETKVEPKQVGKNKSNVGLMVGLAAAVIAILGLGGGLAYVFMKPDKPVAKAPAKATTPAFDPDEEDDADVKKPAAADDSSDKEDEKKEEVVVDPDEEVAKTAGAAEAEKAPAVAATDPAKPDPTKPATDAPAATPEKPADTPMPMPMPAATAETPAPMPMPAPMPAAGAATPAVGAATPAAGAATPAAGAATPAAAPADPKLEDPFREVETALEIPVFVDAQTSTTPVVLAKVYPKEGDRVNAKLLAGDVVLAKLGDFVLSGGALTDPEPKWTIKFVDRQGKTTPVANLAFKANEISFAWTGEGDAEKNNVLKNCLLQVTAGYSNKRLPLRKPIEIEPLSVLMEPKGTTLPIEIIGLPEDRDTVIMEFTKLVGGFPADATYDPGQQIKPGETVSVMFGKLDLAFKGNFAEERGKGLKLDWRPMLRGPKPRNNGPRPLKPFAIKPGSIDKQLEFVQQSQTNGTTNYNAVKAKIAEPMKAQKLEQLELAYQQATEQNNNLTKQLTEMKTAIDLLSKEGKVQFRIFMRVGDYSIELVKTKDYSPPEAAAPAAAAPAK